MKLEKFSREWASLSESERKTISKHQLEAPIQVGRIAKELGATVKSSTLKAGISGEIRESGGQILIRVNRHDNKPRQRFTLAHEIGHMLLHRDRIGDGIVDDILYRSTLSDTLEAQANRLAADILMPYHLVMRKLDELEDIVDEEVKYERVAQEFEVSTTALKIRIGKL